LRPVASGEPKNSSERSLGSWQLELATKAEKNLLATLTSKWDRPKVTYEHLLDQFFKMHDPTTMNRQGNDQGTQYRSEIFTYTPEQSKEASAFMAKVEKSKAWKAPITTKVEPAKTFFEAEDYHQQYLIKNPGGYDNHHLRNLNFDSSSK
jgi:methionine-S-sulfoxide reductase